MSGRHRALPSWMAQEKKGTEQPLKSSRTRKAARAAFYCLNEKELLEAAVSYLTDGAVGLPTDLQSQGEDEAAATTVTTRENAATSKPRTEQLTLEESSDCGGALDTTCVSETDTDITEVGTLLCTNSMQHQEPKGQRSGPEPAHGGMVSVGLKAEGKEEHSQRPAEEDDALRLVRDIFFT